MATHLSALAWKIPRTEEPVPIGYRPWGREESDTTEQQQQQHGELSLLSQPEASSEGGSRVVGHTALHLLWRFAPEHEARKGAV